MWQGHVPKAWRDSPRLPCGGEARLFIYRVSVVFLSPLLILYLSELSNETAFSPCGKWLFEVCPPLIFYFVEGEFVGKGILTNVS